MSVLLYMGGSGNLFLGCGLFWGLLRFPLAVDAYFRGKLSTPEVVRSGHVKKMLLPISFVHADFSE